MSETPQNTPLDKVRNIGIIAHIDAGKTTATERFLYYTGRKHKIGETHDWESEMDWMSQEKDRGITITSATTVCFWNDYHINIIDTPGHVDFTVEVERALRVLDWGVAIFDGSQWVEPQSETVWRQAERYNVPRLAFVNKMDKMGADFKMSLDTIYEKLTDKAVPIQISWWAAENYIWVIDLIKRKAYTFEGEQGTEVVEHEVPEEYKEELESYRDQMLDKISMFDDDLAEKYLSGDDIEEELIHKTIRKGVLENELYPVLCGSALKNSWVQLLLNAVTEYLPSPVERENVVWKNPTTWEEETRECSMEAPVSALAFKVINDPYVWTLTYARVYSGNIKSWDTLFNPISGKKERIWRLLLMHSNKREEITEIHAGHICAFLWLKETNTGHTICDSKKPIILEEMQFPDPVISIAIEPVAKKDQEKMWVGLSKLWREDPSFKYNTDEETGQTIISWMGELHLEIIVDRLKKEFKVDVNTWQPQVAYREAITTTSEWEGKFIKQTWGRWQYWHVLLRLEPLPQDSEEHYEFSDEITWGTIPKDFISSIDKGAKETMTTGILAGYPIINVKVAVFDGSYHEVDSSEVAFKVATQKAFENAFNKANPILMEPIMKVDVVTPEEYMWDVMWDLSSRRGRVEGQDQNRNAVTIQAKVPLAEMFGYATTLRSITQGRASYIMQIAGYEKIPDQIAKEIIESRQ